MNYADARPLITTGDLIAVRSHRGGLSALTRAVTKSPYTHTAVAIWLGGRLLLAEMNGGGACLVVASKYSDTDFDVFACPVPSGSVMVAIFDLLGMDLGYDFTDLLRIADHELLGIPLPAVDEGGLICSATSATIYLRAGLVRGGLPSIPAPRDVVDWLRVGPTLEVKR